MTVDRPDRISRENCNARTTNLLVEVGVVVHSTNHPRARKAPACQMGELEPEPGAESAGVGDPDDEPRVVKSRAVVPSIQGFLQNRGNAMISRTRNNVGSTEFSQRDGSPTW